MLYILSTATFAQETFLIKKDAVKLSQRCFSITPDQNNKFGAIWWVEKQDISQPFQLDFVIYMGDKDASGADGIAFVMHTDPLDTLGEGAFGEEGGGLGFSEHPSQGNKKITPSVAIEFDTWNNGGGSNDYAEDHTAVVYNGNLLTQFRPIIDYKGDTVHRTPIKPASHYTVQNVENDECYQYTITWDPITLELKLFIDGVRVFTHTGDVLNDVFNGQNMVRYGFTGSTGGARNEQTICLLGGNTEPYARDDYVITSIDTPVNIHITANDNDPDGDDLLKSVITQYPTNGTISLINKDLVLYTPNPGFEGTDTFMYKTCDVASDKCYAKCDEAEVTVDVLCQQPYQISATPLSANEVCEGGVFTGSAQADINPPTGVAPTDLLISHWKYDGNFQDSSPAGGNSILNENTGLQFVNTNMVKGILLDGVDDYLSMTGPKYSLNNYETVTTSSWIRTSSNAQQVIISYDDNHYWELSVEAGIGVINWTVNTDAGKATLLGTTPVNDGQWHFITVSFNQGTLQIYVDGILNSSMTQGTQYGSGTSRYGRIGIGSEAQTVNGNNDPSNAFFQGTIEDTRLYDKALSPQEIEDLFYSATPFPPLTANDFNFYWFDGTNYPGVSIASGQLVTGLPDGLYTVVAENKITGCLTDTAQVTIERNIPTFEPVIWEVAPFTSCDTPNGVLQAGIISGSDTVTAGYDFVWYESDFVLTGDTISVSNIAANLSSRSYSVLVRNQLTNCDTIISLPVSSFVTAPTVSAQVDQHITACNAPNAGIVEASVLGDTINYSFTWYPEGSNIPIGNTAKLSGLTFGRYSVIAKDKGTGCNSAPFTIEVSNNSTIPNVSITTSPQISCDINAPTGSVTAVVNTGSGTTTNGYTFRWYKGHNSSVPAKAGYTIGPNVSGLTAGNYRLVVSNNLTGCTTTIDTNIAENIITPSLTINNKTNINQCNSLGSALFSVSGGSGGFDYYWYTGNVSAPDTTNSLNTIGNVANSSSLTVGTYTVYAANKISRCLSNGVTFNINDNTYTPLLNAEVQNIQTSCTSLPNGQLFASVNESANGGAAQDTISYTFEWYFGDFTTANLPSTADASGSSVKNLAAGDYTVRAINTATNCSNLAHITLPENLNYPNIESLNVIHASRCADPWGSSVTAIADGGMTVSDGYTFTWMDITNGTTLAINSNILSNIAPGDYQLIVTSPFGCQSAPRNFTINPVINPFVVTTSQLQPQRACSPLSPNGQLRALVDGDSVGYSFEWYSGTLDKTTALAATPIFTGATAKGLAAGAYTVLVSNNSTSCSMIAFRNVLTNQQTPVIDAGATLNHANTCASPWGSQISVTADGGKTNADGYTFSWRNVSTGTNLTETSNTLTNIPPGQYRVIVTSPFGCKSTQRNFTINPVTNPFIVTTTQLQAQKACSPVPPSGQLRALVAGDSVGYTFKWISGTLSKSAAISAVGTVANTATAKGLAAGAYTVLVTDNSTSCSMVAYENVLSDQQTPVIDASATLNHANTCASPWGSQISVTADGGKTNADGYTFSWRNISTGTNLTETSHILSNIPPGQYRVIVTSPFGCKSTQRNFTIEDQSVKPTINLSATDNISCSPASPSGTINASGFMGTAADYTFEWFVNNTTGSAVPVSKITNNGTRVSSLAAGKYMLRMTNNLNQCITTATVTINSNPEPAPIIDTVSTTVVTSCTPADYDGEIVLTLRDSFKMIPPDLTLNRNYTFRLTGPNGYDNSITATSNITFTDLGPGNYQAVATDNLTGCVSSPINITLVQKPLKELNISYTRPTNCGILGIGNGDASVSVETDTNSPSISGSPGFSYSWTYEITGGAVTSGTDAPFTSTRELLGPGYYVVEIEDLETSCTYTERFLLKMADPPTLTIDDVNNSTQCANTDGSIDLTLTSSATSLPLATYMVHLFKGNAIKTIPDATWVPLLGNTHTFNNLEPGQYLVALQIGISPYCYISDSLVSIGEDYADPIVNITKEVDYSCNSSGTGRLSASVSGSDGSPISDFTLNWYNGNTASGTPFHTGSSTPATLNAGTYTLEVIDDTGLGRGCVFDTTVTLNNVPKDIRISNFAKTDRDGCIVSNFGSAHVIEITENGTPIASDYSILLFDENFDPLTKPGDGSVATPFTGLDKGVYFLVTENNITGCQSVPQRIEIFDNGFPPVPALVVTQPDFSCGIASEASGHLTARGYGASDGDVDQSHFTFQWFRGQDNTNPADALPTSHVSGTYGEEAINLTAGHYTILVTDINGNGNGCSEMSSIEVPAQIKNINITATVIPPVACAGEGSIEVNSVSLFDAINGTQVANLSDYNLVLQDENGVEIDNIDGSITATFTNISLGDYRVLAQHKSFICWTSTPTNQTISDLNEPPVAVLTVEQPDFSCGDASQASGHLIASAFGPYDGDTDLSHFSFQWFSGQDNTNPADALPLVNLSGANNSEAVNLLAGFYTLVVTDINGNGNACSDMISVEVPELVKEINIVTNVIDPLACSGLGDIEVISVTVYDPINGHQSANLSDYHLVLLDESGTEISMDGNLSTVFSNQVEGNYQVLARNKTLTCWVSNPNPETIIDLNEQPDISLIAIEEDYSCDGGTPTGAISISAKGPNDNDTDPTHFDYRWYQGNTVDIANQLSAANIDSSNPAKAIGLTSGVYTVEVVDLTAPAVNCSSTQTFNVPNVITNISITANAIDQLVCNAGGSVFVNSVIESPSNGSATSANPESFDYLLYDDNNNLITAAGSGKPSDPYTNLSEGNYYIQAVSTDGNNCMSQLRGFTINDLSRNPLVSIQKISDQYSNNTDPLSWSGSLSARVNVDPANPLDSVANNFNYSYAWYTAEEYPSGTAFSNNDHVDQLDEGNYYVIVTNTVTGCSTVASAYVNKIIEIPFVNYIVDAPQITCLSDASIIIDELTQNGITASPVDYEFKLYASYPDGLITTMTKPSNDTIFTNLAEGIYNVSIYHTLWNIEGELLEVIIEKDNSNPVVDLDVINYQIQSSCDPAQPNGTLAVEVYEADYSVGNYSFQWYKGKEASATTIINGARDRILSNVESGYYVVEVTNQNTFCTTEQMLYLEERISTPIVSASTSPNIYCDPSLYNGLVSATVINSNSRTFGNARSGARYRYTWYRGNKIKPAPEFVGKTWENVPPGVYTVLVTDLWSPACVSEPVTVELIDMSSEPEITIVQDAPQSHCDPDLVNGKLAAYVNDSIYAYQYIWYDESGEVISQTYQATNLKVQTYRVEVINQVTGCATEATYTLEERIKQVEAPSITINAHQTRCDVPDGTVTATIPGLISDFDFFWYDAAGNEISLPNPATKLSGLEAGSYSLKLIEKRSGCETALVSFEILDETFPPTFEIMTEPAVCEEKSGLIRIVPHDISSISRVEWYSPDGIDLIGNGFELTAISAGEYSYQVYGTNGCIVEGNVSVEADINVFNGLSPNGDGDNDYFHIDCLDYFRLNNVKIFNRAGALVYEANYYDNLSVFFEGRGNRGLYVGGKDLPAGTYFYVIDKRDNISKPKTGYLELTW